MISMIKEVGRTIGNIFYNLMLLMAGAAIMGLLLSVALTVSERNESRIQSQAMAKLPINKLAKNAGW